MAIQVGKKLFRLPTLWHVSMSSEVFAGVVGLTEGGLGENGTGSSEDDPIVLQDDPDDFEAFCMWLFQLK